MDLHVTAAKASPEEEAAVDSVLGAPQNTWVGGLRNIEVDGRTESDVHPQRHLLLPVLHAIQEHIGWISPGAVNYASVRLDVPPAETYGVASFYGMFAMKEQPAVVAHVCDDIACMTRGAEGVCEEMERSLGPANSPCASGRAIWKRSPCLGLCERAPAALITAAGKNPRERVIAPATAESVRALAEDAVNGKMPAEADRLDVAVSVPQVATGDESSASLGAAEQQIPPDRSRDSRPSSDARHTAAKNTRLVRDDNSGSVHGKNIHQPTSAEAGIHLLRRVGKVNPGSVEDYERHGGYEALRKAFELGADGVIREMIASKLLGRGGAAFPTGKKWEALHTQRHLGQAHYVICNADESEPGTFKDRIVMEGDPFAILEGMTIAGLATGAAQGYIYVRGEYPLAAERLHHAIQEARAHGMLGENILGKGLDFDIELRRGAGAYICGEETALFNSIEGYRGEPRNKPPFPTVSGLFRKPTVVNNVETLINVPQIILMGGEAYAQIGTGSSCGYRLFCVSGHVTRPGVYEVPFGPTLRDVIAMAGGVGGNGRLQAVLLGGAAGGFVTPKELDIPLTFEGTRAAGTTLGSGVVLLFDDSVDLKKILLRIAAFFRDETCGQCVPCRVGTVRQEELLHRLVKHKSNGSNETDVKTLQEVAQAMRDASICGLGQTAPSALLSAMSRWSLFS